MGAAEAERARVGVVEWKGRERRWRGKGIGLKRVGGEVGGRRRGVFGGGGNGGAEGERVEVGIGFEFGFGVGERARASGGARNEVGRVRCWIEGFGGFVGLVGIGAFQEEGAFGVRGRI